jgi:hypothetical protein
MDSIINFLTSDLFAALGGGFVLGTVLMLSGVVSGEPQDAAPVAAVLSVAG